MVLVDGHVHVYDCFSVPAVFDAAAANFAAAADTLEGAGRYDSVLCLVEGARERFLADVRSGKQGRVWRGTHGYWEAELGDEPEVVTVRRGGTRLLLLAGRQLVTRERLEVLALGTTAPLHDGASLEDTLAAVRDAAALAVLPWGVGKWVGARGAIVSRALDDPQWSHVLVGDNGNRLSLSPEPTQLARARREGRRVLPGSDPLPLPGQESRVGSYGFALHADLDPLRPAAALRALLAGRASLVPFGRRARLARFVGNQLALQLKTRLRRA
jgi:hypothetical protein